MSKKWQERKKGRKKNARNKQTKEVTLLNEIQRNK